MEQTYDKQTVATHQLETALRLFFEAADYLSVITLAGAAEEILGKLLAAKGIENSLDNLKTAVSAIHEHLYGEPLTKTAAAQRANLARNHLKHHDPDDSPTVTLDAKQEAEDLLNRGIDNFWLLEKRLTPAMADFQRRTIVA